MAAGRRRRRFAAACGARPSGADDPRSTATAPRPRVVVADDNADMREYIRRLLAGRYEVNAVADGQAALAVARADRPDLVLTDVMMPRLDGFGLLRELRADPQTAAIPVIMLSARAGEEARVDGIQSGADDYLVKPFSARELQARVSAHIELARARRAAAAADERAAVVLESITDAFFALDSEWRFTYMNAEAERINGVGRGELLGKNHWEFFAPALGTVVEREYRRAVAEQVAVEFENYYQPYEKWFGSELTRLETGASRCTSAISPIERRPKRRRWPGPKSFKNWPKRTACSTKSFARMTSEKTNSWRCSPTSCATHSPPSATPSPSSKCRAATEHVNFAKDVIERQVRQLVRLIDDLLDVARITSGKIHLKKEFLDAAVILEQAIESVRPLINERKHELITSFEKGALPIWADPTRIEQIVVNLLTNAAKYTESGGRIWLTAARGTVQCRHQGAGQRHRHPARETARHVPALLAGGAIDRPLGRGPGHRADHRAPSSPKCTTAA